MINGENGRLPPVDEIPTCTILVAHNHQDGRSNVDFRQLAEKLANRLAQPVLACALDAGERPLLNAISQALREGAVRLVILPLFLSPAEYSNNAVAEAVTFASRRYPFLQFHLSPPLTWQDWVALVAKAHMPALADFSLAETAVILATKSDIPEVNSDMSKLARLLYEANDFGWIEAAFVGKDSKPSLSAMVQRLKRLGTQHLVMVPWILFEGTTLKQMRNTVARDAAVTTMPHLAAQPALLDLLIVQREQALADRSLLPISWEELERQLTAELNTHDKIKPSQPALDEGEYQQLNAKINAILPPRYQGQSDTVSPAPMAATDLVYNEDGDVAWDEIFGLDDPDNPFCELALAGGPSHRGELLEAVTAEACQREMGKYTAVVAEIERGIQTITGLSTVKSPALGWLGVVCDSEEMAIWLVRAIIVENVMVRREGNILFLPAGPHFTLKDQIKSIVTVTAKTWHYWNEHVSFKEQLEVAKSLADEEAVQENLAPARLPS